MTYVVERAPNGWKASHELATDDPGDLCFEPLSASEAVEGDAECRKQAGARLLAKVYEVDPLVCPGCMAEQRAKCATRLVKIAGAVRRCDAQSSPPGVDPLSLN